MKATTNRTNLEELLYVQTERRGIFERYIGEIATSCHAINGTDPKKLYDALLKQAAKKTKEADQKLDLDGKVVAGKQLEDDEDVIILADRQGGSDGDDAGEDLFGGTPAAKTTRKKKKKTKKKSTRSRS